MILQAIDETTRESWRPRMDRYQSAAVLQRREYHAFPVFEHNHLVQRAEREAFLLVQGARRRQPARERVLLRVESVERAMIH